MDFFVKKILNNYSFNFCLKLFNFVFFISFLLIGLNIYKDFGISLDEVGYRHQGITVAYTLAKYLNLDLIQLLPKDKEFLDIESYKKQDFVYQRRSKTMGVQNHMTLNMHLPGNHCFLYLHYVLFIISCIFLYFFI